MFRVLRFTAKATLADVARSICRTPARRIALVFPLGDRTRFADAGRMDALATLCREHAKEATIVGGDELLRACAVACGLRAAVTIEDWREAQPAWSLRRRKANHPAPARLSVIERPQVSEAREAEGAEETDEALDDEVEIDPPAYVQELLALYRQPDDGASGEPMGVPRRQPIQLRRPFVVALRAGTLAYDLDADDRVRALSEDDEERLTTTIRRTSGLDADLFARSWPASVVAAAPDAPKGSR